MGLSIQVEIRGIEPVEQMLERMVSFASRKSGLLHELGSLIRTQHTRRILSEKTSPDGAAWAALAAYTVEKKGNGNILVDSGAMAGAWALNYGGDSVEMHNTRPKRTGDGPVMPLHQGGTSKMPARPVMGFSESNLHEIEQVVQRWIAALIG